MRILGIDLGSRFVKIILFEKEQIIFKQMISTLKFYKEYCLTYPRLHIDMNKLNINFDIAISTGYGKNNLNLEDTIKINELKAHVYGAIFQTNLRYFSLLDIGGQDVKIMKVENGIIIDLDLNEKCAASCGRYLENMANLLEVPINVMSKHYLNPVLLNSTCAVFSESELIGKIADGVNLENLYAGVNFSMYNRLKPILTRFYSNNLLISGGTALNDSIIFYLNQDFKNVQVLEDPQFNGAIGCAIYYYTNFINRLEV